MGLFDSLKKKNKPASAVNAPINPLRLGFVLARGNEMPSAEKIADSAKDLGETNLKAAESGKDGILSFEHPLGDFMVTLVSVRHPDAAKMQMGPFSPSTEEIMSTSAHFITILMGEKGSVRERDLALLRLTGAVALANRAVAAMAGHGIMFHRTAKFIQAIVESGDNSVPIPDMVDITMASEPNGRASLLTHGMIRYGREELYVTTEEEEEKMKEAYAFTDSVASLMLTSDEVFNNGETVGRSAEERINVRRTKSPIDPNAQVIRLDL